MADVADSQESFDHQILRRRNDREMKNTGGSIAEQNSNNQSVPTAQTKCNRIRNLAGFWLLGLTNNFAYVIMLSAAHDILEVQEKEANAAVINSTAVPINSTVLETTPLPLVTTAAPNNRTPLVPNCNPISTGAVLLADILPTLIIKLSAPFYMQSLSYWFRVGFLIAVPCLASFLIVALSPSVPISIFGVVFASIGGGFGEITFLALSSHFHKDVISTWSSGTGGAGVFGALSYAGLTSIGVSPRNTLLILVFIPVLLALSYYVMIKKPDTVDPNCACSCRDSEVLAPLLSNEEDSDSEQQNPLLFEENAQEISTEEGPSIVDMEKGKHLTLKEKFSSILPLMKYMIPLALVYLAEYFINQGLTELLYFENAWLSQSEQYRWYQVIYQIGVFISRSSVNCVRIHKLWILPILQFLNIVLLMFQVFYQFIPSIWIVFVIILYEGLLGGAAYVNTFYKISEEVTDDHKEFSIGVASVSDSFGIMIAAFAAMPVHNFLCSLYR